MSDLKESCEEAMPYEMEALTMLDDIAPEDLDAMEHVNEVINTVAMPPLPLCMDDMVVVEPVYHEPLLDEFGGEIIYIPLSQWIDIEEAE
jgi:hypothetical protein